MGMFHSTSGKSGWNYYQSVGTPRLEKRWFELQKAKIKRLLIAEDELRLSDFYQKRYSEKDTLQHLRDVTVEIQKEACKKAGMEYDWWAIETLRAAREAYLDDPEMNQLTVYQRHDTSRRGDLRVGHVAPDAALLDLAGQETTLMQYFASLNEHLSQPLPLVLLVGSVS
jgi:hypothetical protein